MVGQWSCAILPVTQAEMLAAISIGQILAVLVPHEPLGSPLRLSTESRAGSEPPHLPGL